MSTTLRPISNLDALYAVTLLDLGGYAAWDRVRKAAGIKSIMVSDDCAIRLHQAGYLNVPTSFGPSLSPHGRIWADKFGRMRARRAVAA